MERFEFDNRKVANRANGNRREEITVHGAVEIYHDNFRDGLLSLDIRGPVKAYRGCALMDKATAGKLGAALLTWAMPDNKSLRAHLGAVLAAYEAVTEAKGKAICPVCLEPIKFVALPKLGGPVMFSCGCTP